MRNTSTPSPRARGDVQQLLERLAGFGIDVAAFLRDERTVVAIGTDTMNVDRGVATTFDVHKLLMAVNRRMLDGVARLGGIPPAGAHLFVGAPKHAGAPKHVTGSGASARLIAGETDEG